MCWDISLHSDIEIVKSAFPQIKDERRQLEYDYYRMENIQAIMFPQYPVIYRDRDTGDLGLKEMEWGVLPTYIKDPREQQDRRRNMVNIRSERVLEDKKSYWHRLRNYRCLIPVSGTYEHRAIRGWKKKVPYYIAPAGRQISYIPGLYQWHERVDSDGVIEKAGSFGLMTRSGNTVMRLIHNDGPNKHRMPLFLPKELESIWLSDIKESEMMEVFNYEIGPECLDYIPVYTLRGYPERPDGKKRYERFEWEGLPELGDDAAAEKQASLF